MLISLYFYAPFTFHHPLSPTPSSNIIYTKVYFASIQNEIMRSDRHFFYFFFVFSYLFYSPCPHLTTTTTITSTTRKKKKWFCPHVTVINNEN